LPKKTGVPKKGLINDSTANLE
jgi:hypothetical protein